MEEDQFLIIDGIPVKEDKTELIRSGQDVKATGVAGPCPTCSWSGTYEQLVEVDYTYKYTIKALTCPSCGARLCAGCTVVALPYSKRRYCCNSCKNIGRPYLEGTAEKHRINMLGNKYGSHAVSEEHKKAISEALRIRWKNPAYRERESKLASERFRKMNEKNWANPEFRARRSELGVPHFKGFHDSPKAGRVFYRSSWERDACLGLDDCPRVKMYTFEPFTVPYIDSSGVDRLYWPDILVEYYDRAPDLVEIKPRKLLRYLNVQLKIRAGEIWAENLGMNFSVWTEETWPKEIVRECLTY